MDQTYKSALTLYVKLYCKRKNRRNETNGRINKSNKYLVEATQSWLSLKENEKQQFVDKQKEYVTKYRKLFANYLKNAEPYLKKKDGKSKHRNDAVTVKDKPLDPESPLMEHESQENTSLDAPATTTDKDSSWPATQMEAEPLQNTEEPQDARTYECELPEPTPPSLITSKELFEATNTTDEGIVSRWEALSKAEKYRYQFAVRAIKQEYINRYKAYLESLPSNKLFDHYIKVL